MRFLISIFCLLCVCTQSISQSQNLVQNVEAQPLLAQIERLEKALESIGNPFSAQTRKILEGAKKEENDSKVVQKIQSALDPLCLAYVKIHKDNRVVVQNGAAKPLLQEQGWQLFLIKVHNEAGIDTTLRIESPQAKPLPESPPNEVKNRWLDLQLLDSTPLQATLSGLELEYRPILLYSKNAGKQTATLNFNIGYWKNTSGSTEKSGGKRIREWSFGKGTDG